VKAIKQTLEAQGIKASIIRRTQRMWKVKEFSGIARVDYLINNFIKENKIEDFKIEGYTVTHGERLNVIIRYWEDEQHD
jgi:hypothetical protein